MVPRISVQARLRVFGGLALAGVLACAMMAWPARPALASGSAPKGTGSEAASDNAAAANGAIDRAVYSQETAEHYNYRFGADEPFLPSNATTDTGQFIDSKYFISAKYCGHCHQEAYAEWRQTAHANSFRNPWYTKNVNLLIKGKGIEFTRHCEGCHNPTALVSGALTKGSPIDRHFDQDGVTCMACHSIQKVDQRGTGSYVMAQPTALLDENGNPIYGEVPDKEILAHLDRHDRAVMKNFYRTSEFCGACHKAALPRMLNGYKWQRAIFLYDEWQQSSFAKESPLPYYVKPAVSTCQTCHMPSEAVTLPDYGAEPGKLASHRWLGGDTAVFKFYGYDEQMQKTIAFLRNGAINTSPLNVDLFAIQRNGGPVIAPLGSVPVTLAQGDDLLVSVVIQNKGIGHTLIPEQRDFYECWVEFQARDGAGHMLMDSGALEPDGSLDPSAHSFTNRLINVRGTLNDLHQVWDTRVIAYNNTIASGRSQIVRYEFTVPADATGPITITAKVNYRRFNQHFTDFVMGKRYDVPVVEMASRTRTMVLGENLPEKPDPQDNPDWMRWNDYGIGLIDAQQYAESVYAFERVVAMRPDYADGYTNVAISDISWERYESARNYLNRALALAPKNARALYYLALVERIQGNLDAAVADLREVAAQFPRSRDAHRELGYSLFQQHKYAEACAEYQAVQGIDPDDLAGHYMLSILYRRLGRKEDAAREAAIFADQKDDPTANVYALEWLAKHPEVTAESIPWHIHREPAGNAAMENKESGQ